MTSSTHSADPSGSKKDKNGKEDKKRDTAQSGQASASSISSSNRNTSTTGNGSGGAASTRHFVFGQPNTGEFSFGQPSTINPHGGVQGPAAVAGALAAYQPNTWKTLPDSRWSGLSSPGQEQSFMNSGPGSGFYPGWNTRAWNSGQYQTGNSGPGTADSIFGRDFPPRSRKRDRDFDSDSESSFRPNKKAAFTTNISDVKEYTRDPDVKMRDIKLHSQPEAKNYIVQTNNRNVTLARLGGKKKEKTLLQQLNYHKSIGGPNAEIVSLMKNMPPPGARGRSLPSLSTVRGLASSESSQGMSICSSSSRSRPSKPTRGTEIDAQYAGAEEPKGKFCPNCKGSDHHVNVCVGPPNSIHGDIPACTRCLTLDNPDKPDWHQLDGCPLVVTILADLGVDGRSRLSRELVGRLGDNDIAWLMETMVTERLRKPPLRSRCFDWIDILMEFSSRFYEGAAPPQLQGKLPWTKQFALHVLQTWDPAPSDKGVGASVAQEGQAEKKPLPWRTYNYRLADINTLPSGFADDESNFSGLRIEWENGRTASQVFKASDRPSEPKAQKVAASQAQVVQNADRERIAQLERSISRMAELMDNQQKLLESVIPSQPKPVPEPVENLTHAVNAWKLDTQAFEQEVSNMPATGTDSLGGLGDGAPVEQASLGVPLPDKPGATGAGPENVDGSASGTGQEDAAMKDADK
ncbi:hypothetical protein J7T55_003303 [Diaporthe amygdali]|uniref:uncharacterized protein n=1 Tax=Phomopsis amygdali TaxID=1214568 RepID=UPI0022FE6487|nr:uncharacterized protein J7T55_003303 [Diaporthe amygdali]KAJ0103715.1 hypothetical protein J7T55_003303 [Diaporthe amygdali]